MPPWRGKHFAPNSGSRSRRTRASPRPSGCGHISHSRRQRVARAEWPSQGLTAWLQKNAGSIRRIGSICTGIYGLAPSGLLNGRKVATHWKFAADVAKRYPALKVDPGSLYVRDGKFWTAAGVTAGIDLSLALIEEDFGSEVALSVARELVVYMKRSGGQERSSEPLKFQVQRAAALRIFCRGCWRTWSRIFGSRRWQRGFRCVHGSFRGALRKSLGAARHRLCGGSGWTRRGAAFPRRSVRWKA